VTLVNECRRVPIVIRSWYFKFPVQKILLNQSHQIAVRMYGVVTVSLNYTLQSNVLRLRYSDLVQGHPVDFTDLLKLDTILLTTAT